MWSGEWAGRLRVRLRVQRVGAVLSWRSALLCLLLTCLRLLPAPRAPSPPAPPSCPAPWLCLRRSELPGELEKVLVWFRDYKMPDGKPANKFGYDNKCMNKEFAMEVGGRSSGEGEEQGAGWEGLGWLGWGGWAGVAGWQRPGGGAGSAVGCMDRACTPVGVVVEWQKW